MGGIAQSEVIDGMIHGIEEAQRFYSECSNEWLGWGPEYLVSVFIARKLHGLYGAKWVTMEMPVRKCLEEAQSKCCGAPPKKLRIGGRFDIVLYWGNGQPRAAIEVKNWVGSYDRLHRDVDRIVAAVKRKRETIRIQFGAVAFYTSAEDSGRNVANKIIQDRIDRIRREAQDNVPADIQASLISGKIHVVDDSAWAAACIVLRP